MATDRLEAILAEARNLSTDELAQLIKQATDMLAKNSKTEQARKGDITRFFGSWKSGNPNSADNELIDADLAREYGKDI